MVTMTKPNLPATCQWLDNTLPGLYNMHINEKIDVTTLHCLTPCHLDKLILTAACTVYADKLKN